MCVIYYDVHMCMMFMSTYWTIICYKQNMSIYSVIFRVFSVVFIVGKINLDNERRLKWGKYSGEGRKAAIFKLELLTNCLKSQIKSSIK